MKDLISERELSLLTDFYELTMANGYVESGMADTVACFDLFYRRNPDNGGFVIAAGLEQMIEYLNSLSFSDRDIEFLHSKGMFSEKFINYLKNFRFSCDVWAVPEGTPVFPYEPIVTVCGPIIQAQLVETMLLLCINHQSLIATKANRIVRAAAGRSVMEFGARRAQGFDGAVFGARAAYIGGVAGTSCASCDRDFAIPALGTMAHSWVQSFDCEEDAFCAYARIYPESCTLLVDTYNTLESGIPNAIKAFNKELVPRGCRPVGIRIDSGDITYLSKKARNMLDDAGFPDCKICASNSLDEYTVRDMLMQGAKVDLFGVGERLITSSSQPVLGGVYKLCAIGKNGKLVPKIKISDNIEKITNPGMKKLWRLYDKVTGKAIADVITTDYEIIDDSKPYEIFDPQSVWKRKVVTDFFSVPLLKPYFSKGKLIEKLPDLTDIRAYCENQLDTLWDEVKRFENPHKYYVDLSQELWNLKESMLNCRE